MTGSKIILKGHSRVFLFETDTGPTESPEYLSYSAAGTLEKSFGSNTRVEVPSSTQRLGYDVATTFLSGEENATSSVTLRDTTAISELYKLGGRKCGLGFQYLVGLCSDPRDYDNGWEKILAFENVTITDFSRDEIGSLQSDDEGPVLDTVEFDAESAYEIVRLSMSERAQSEVDNEVITIVVGDSISCGDCDTVSDGCSRVYAITAPAGSSPGLLPEVLVSTDGVTTIANESPITTLAIGEDPSGGAAIGVNLIVISNDSNSLHYANLDDLATGAETWTEVTSGFVVSGEPNAITSPKSPRETWIVGDGGYVYFSESPIDGVTVQDAGNVTTDNLLAVDSISIEDAVAVGANNTVIHTTNRGNTWTSVTGPDTVTTPSLTAVAMRSDTEWWVGTDDGKLYYTIDSGVNWTEKAFQLSGTGTIKAIVWASNSVGYIAHERSSAGRILRTFSGGNSWVVMPEDSTAIPANDRVNSLAVCEKEVNVLYAAGLADNGADGIIIKAVGS